MKRNQGFDLFNLTRSSWLHDLSVINTPREKNKLSEGIRKEVFIHTMHVKFKVEIRSNLQVGYISFKEKCPSNSSLRWSCQGWTEQKIFSLYLPVSCLDYTSQRYAGLFHGITTLLTCDCLYHPAPLPENYSLIGCSPSCIHAVNYSYLIIAASS